MADKSKLTILFEEPFWIGLIEREEGGRYEVCKVTFGAEPKDSEVYEYMLRQFSRLTFSPPLSAKPDSERKINPKRLTRMIRRQVSDSDSGIGTKAQMALKLQQEQNKTERRVVSRAEREAEKARKFDLHEQKRKEKHRGH